MAYYTNTIRDRFAAAVSQLIARIDLKTGERRGGTNSQPEHVQAVADACLTRARAKVEVSHDRSRMIGADSTTISVIRSMHVGT